MSRDGFARINALLALMEQVTEELQALPMDEHDQRMAEAVARARRTVLDEADRIALGE